ncbi:AfsA-related hotdog domain-containing protein [Pyxidicoccus sp. 3LG]
MTQNVLHVVGERFTGFASENPEVITLPELERMLQGDGLPGELTLVIGQGIPDERLRQLQAHLERLPARMRVSLVTDPRDLTRAESRLVHKRFEHNILISTPEQVVEGERYVSRLVLDERCAEMSDHLTGQHIQGMVLMEAARQMVLAVTERYFLSGSGSRANYFVLNQLDATYHSFGFPLGMDVEYHGVSRKESKGGSLSCEAKICFLQGGELLTEVRIRSAVYDAAFLGSREAKKARQALARATPLQRKAN